MYSLERFGRPTAVTAFLLTAEFGLLWANAGSEAMVLAIGFGMIFFIQLAGNSSQIFISEVFPTNARASGFGLCQAAGRDGAFVAIPSFLWIQQGFGLTAVFVVIAMIVAIAAVSVTNGWPKAPPTTRRPIKTSSSSTRPIARSRAASARPCLRICRSRRPAAHPVQ